MLTGRKRDLLPQKTEPTPFAARAKDLGALRDAVVDAASVGAGLWISYLFALFYFAIAAGAVTHRDLLLESPVKLPFLNVELPLKAFFILGPLVFLIVHAYVLVHFVLLTGKIGAFHLELQTQISGDDARAWLRRQLPSNIFVQSLAGPREVRTGIIGFLMRLIIEISLVAGPIALLILFQLQFLPYQSEWITSWQRLAVVIDLILLWLLWPSIARGETARLGWNDFRSVKVLASLLVSTLAVLLVVTIATFPGEWLEEKLPPVRLIPTTWPAWTTRSDQATDAAESGWVTLHQLLVAGQVNYVTGRLHSLWSNVLVLPNFEVGDRKLTLRGRSLEGAVLVSAHLRKADFTGASLAGAEFAWADLHEAKFNCHWARSNAPFLPPKPYGTSLDKDLICAQMQGADFGFAQLQGASLENAQLQGAVLFGTGLQGANLDHAQLQGAMIADAQLKGALLTETQLQGATLLRAQLQGADLRQAQLQGAVLDQAQLQGADLGQAQLQGASLDQTQLQGADLGQAQLQGASLDQAQLQGASLIKTELQGASLIDAGLKDASLQNDFVWRTNPPMNSTGAFVDAPEPGPKYFGPNCSGECDWSETSYAALKSLIENTVQLDFRRQQALGRIAILEKPPYVADEGSAKAWTDLAKKSARPLGSYFDTLANKFKEIGCAAEGAPYVIDGLTWRLDDRFGGNLLQQAEIAAAFLDEAKCPGARGLSEENKAKLQEIRDRGLPGPPGPGAAAR